MEIELVIFGLLGTTVIDDGLVARPLAAALANADVSVDEETLASVGGEATPQAIRALLQQARPDVAWAADEVERIHGDFVRRAVARASSEEPVREVVGATQTFWQLKQHGVKIASVTGLSLSAADALHDRLGWRSRGLIDVCVTSDEVERGAPFPDAIYETMLRAGVREAARVVFVANACAELKQATAAGCGLVIGVFDAGGSFVRVRSAPHNVLLPTCALVPELLNRITARRIAPIAFGWT